jgi:uncharacterized cupredoxin-like copper-binding protein
MKILFGIMAVFALSGCASLNFDQSLAKTNQDTADFTGGKLELAQSKEQRSAQEKKAAQFLAQPLSQSDAVQLALVNSPALQAMLAQNWTEAANAAPVIKEQKEWGIAGDAKSVNRTVTFTMTDKMRFSPEKLEVKQGETIKFVIKNGGKVIHEMVLGTKKDLDEHAAMMVKFPDMEHEEPYMAHVGPGKSGEIIWTFNKPGTFDYACLIAGHYQAGMVGKVTVVASK